MSRTIDFPCACGHQFSLQAEMAGGSVQCPSCRLLVSVPSFEDHLAPDGTYLPLPLTDESHGDLDSYRRAFGKTKTDEAGNELDLRPTLFELARAGVESQKLKPTVAEQAPRYDPGSGELVRPLEVAPSKEEPAPPSDKLPTAPANPPVKKNKIAYAKLAVTYEAGSNNPPGVPAAHVPIELLRPINLAVMLFVFMAHAGWFILYIMAAPLLMSANVPVWPMAIPLVLLLFIHYANVVDEIGPEGVDELPRPLRSLSWSQDLFGPLLRVITGLLICYWPAGVLIWLGDERLQAVTIFFIVLGTVMVPAVLLTTITSGGFANLRPDRLLTVMRKLGVAYWGLVIFWAILVPFYALALLGRDLFVGSLTPHSWISQSLTPGVHFGLLAAAIYLAHLFCWLLGLLYRAHHEAFPWVMIQYLAEREREKARAAQEEIDKARKQAGLPVEPAPQEVARARFRARRAL